MRLKARNKPGEFIIAYTTVEKKADAVRISETVIKEELAACVNIIPGLTSIYKWKGKTVRAKEYLLVIKSRKDMSKKLKNRLKTLSSYEVPEFISVDISYGNKDYLKWLYQNTKPSKRRKP